MFYSPPAIAFAVLLCTARIFFEFYTGKIYLIYSHNIHRSRHPFRFWMTLLFEVAICGGFIFLFFMYLR